MTPRRTERQQAVKQPGTCIQRHGSVDVPYKKAGDGDIVKGFGEFEPDAFRRSAQAGLAPRDLQRLPLCEHHAVARDRPGFSEGIRAYKASVEVQNYDVNKQPARQEMRAYVCGQCHAISMIKAFRRLLSARLAGQ